jgi:DinB family protein
MTANPADRAATIDPVANPSAYQAHMLASLGRDDPAVAQAETPARLRTLLADAGPDLRTRPEPAEWSVLELIGHIVDAEVVCTGRYRWILVHDDADIVAYDQDLWAERLRHNEQDPLELLDLFDALRAANLKLWARTPAAGRARVGLHRERGPESYDLTFRMLAGHDRVHMDQARATLASVRAL